MSPLTSSRAVPVGHDDIRALSQDTASRQTLELALPILARPLFGQLLWVLLLSCLLLCTRAIAQQSSTSQRAELQWPSWRGPNASGHIDAAKPPIEWSETKNVRWKTALPGLGLSTPIVHRDRIYLTTAIQTERAGKADVDTPRDRRALPRPTKYYEFALLAVDLKSGDLVWRKKVTETVPHEGGHSTNSHASSSPVTDGSHIYVSFGSRGLYCLDLEGNVVWSKQLGRMKTRRQYGEGSSPCVFGNRLVLNWDHEGDSFIVVFDKKTGDELWRKARDEVTSWSTPLVVEVDGKPQIVINATTASRGYDLESGNVIWELGGMTVNCIPSPIYQNGVVYLMSGYRGRALQAVKLAGARGDLAGSSQLAWTYGQRVSYVPSALLYGDHYYFVRGNSGVLSCLDAKTGEPHYEGQKLGDVRSVYASPVGAGGHVYVTSRDGVTQVLRHGKRFVPVATNRINDEVDASMAIIGDEILLRGRRKLYCISHSAQSSEPRRQSQDASDRAASASQQASKKNVKTVKASNLAKPALRYDPLALLSERTDRSASLSTGDLDGDGDLDLVVANGRHWPAQNLVYLNDGKGEFGEPRKLGAPSKSYAAPLADLDGDGDLDCVVGNDREPSRVFWGDGKGAFARGPDIGSEGPVRHTVIADLNGDKRPDVVFAKRGSANTICFNSVDKSFAQQAEFGASDGPTTQIAAADLDGDGDIDLVTANRGAQNFVYLNDGKGRFGKGLAYGSGSDRTRGVAVADLDGDGKLDLVNANVGEPNAIYFGNGKGGFARQQNFGSGQRSFAVIASDIDGDGNVDLAIANAVEPNEVWLQRQRESEVLVFNRAFFGSKRHASYGLVAFDADKDGRVELAVANSDKPNYLFSRSRANSRLVFNGKDLSGWHSDIPRADNNKDLPASFVVEAGVLVSKGRPQGHLISDESFANYRLVVDWRWPAKPGNCGILVHASRKRMLYKMFPQSIECQLHRGNAGDFWCIGEDIKVPDMIKRRGPAKRWGVVEGRARRIANLTNGSENPAGQWNTMVIVCRDRRVDVWVNGDYVNNGYDCTANKGQIAIQAEGARCEFRRVELTPLISR